MAQKGKPNIVMIFPPSQGADTLSMHKAIETAMRKMESPHGSSN
jgi:hypothetical protein